MEITRYIFKPVSRADTDDLISNSSRAAAARNIAMDANSIQFMVEPRVGERAILKTDSEENGMRIIATSTLRSVEFNEDSGIVELRTLNSVYIFKADYAA